MLEVENFAKFTTLGLCPLVNEMATSVKFCFWSQIQADIAKAKK